MWPSRLSWRRFGWSIWSGRRGWRRRSGRCRKVTRRSSLRVGLVPQLVRLRSQVGECVSSRSWKGSSRHDLPLATTGCRTRIGVGAAFVSGLYFRIADGGIDGRRGLRISFVSADAVDSRTAADPSAQLRASSQLRRVEPASGVGGALRNAGTSDLRRQGAVALEAISGDCAAGRQAPSRGYRAPRGVVLPGGWRASCPVRCQ